MEEFKVANNFFFDIIYMYVEGVSTIDDSLRPLKNYSRAYAKCKSNYIAVYGATARGTLRKKIITYKVTKY